MPIHDWTRVDAGIFHGFHFSWVAKLVESLNTGGLSEGYYADAEPSEQHVVELFDPLPRPTSLRSNRLRVPADTIRRTAARSKWDEQRQRRVVIRYTCGHRLVGVIELAVPRNTRNRAAALQFQTRSRLLINAGVHLTVIDLFPPTRGVRRGLAPGIWRKYDRVPLVAPPGQPLCLASVRATDRPEGFFKFLAASGRLTDRVSVRNSGKPGNSSPTARNLKNPSGRSVADTYAAAFAGSPPYLRELLSAPAPTGG